MTDSLFPGREFPSDEAPVLLDSRLLESTTDIGRVIDHLSQYQSGNSHQLVVRDEMISFAEQHQELALHRSCEPGHFTASAIVIERGTERFLVLFHTKLEKWLQPGGHVDGSSNLPASALREAIEETGIPDLEVALPAVDLDIHEVRPPNEVPHLHYDIRFLVLARTGSQPIRNYESREIRWVTLEDLDALGCDESVSRLARRGLELARVLEDRNN